jgi:hypothetical protein
VHRQDEGDGLLDVVEDAPAEASSRFTARHGTDGEIDGLTL